MAAFDNIGIRCHFHGGKISCSEVILWNGSAWGSTVAVKGSISTVDHVEPILRKFRSTRRVDSRRLAAAADGIQDRGTEIGKTKGEGASEKVSRTELVA